MIRRAFISAGILAMAFTILVSGSVVHAQAPTPSTSNQSNVNNGNGLRISPVRNDISIKPGGSQTLDIYVQNITSSPARLQGVINDFVASEDESGKPRILLDDNQSAPSHGLKQYVSKVSDFDLAPQEQKIIKVKVSIPSSAAGGGYFGAVRFLPTGVSTSKNVSLSASVASIILVTVPGNVTEQVGIESFNISRTDSGKASNFYTNGNNLVAAVRFKNSGNLQEAPFGKIIVKKSGNIVGTYEVNDTQPRGSILPDSVRKYTVALGNKTYGFGKYTVEGNFGYGSNGQLLTAKSSFIVVPVVMVVALIILIIAIIAAGVIFPRMLKSHDRKLLRKVRGRK